MPPVPQREGRPMQQRREMKYQPCVMRGVVIRAAPHYKRNGPQTLAFRVARTARGCDESHPAFPKAGLTGVAKANCKREKTHTKKTSHARLPCFWEKIGFD